MSHDQNEFYLNDHKTNVAEYPPAYDNLPKKPNNQNKFKSLFDSCPPSNIHMQQQQFEEQELPCRHYKPAPIEIKTWIFDGFREWCKHCNQLTNGKNLIRTGNMLSGKAKMAEIGSPQNRSNYDENNTSDLEMDDYNSDVYRQLESLSTPIPRGPYESERNSISILSHLPKMERGTLPKTTSIGLRTHPKATSIEREANPKATSIELGANPNENYDRELENEMRNLIEGNENPRPRIEAHPKDTSRGLYDNMGGYKNKIEEIEKPFRIPNSVTKFGPDSHPKDPQPKYAPTKQMSEDMRLVYLQNTHK